jgi:hypothetical protein
VAWLLVRLAMFAVLFCGKSVKRKENVKISQTKKNVLRNKYCFKKKECGVK